MAIQKWTIVLLFALYTGAEGYRVNALSNGKVEARGKSKAKVNFRRVRSTGGAESNSSIFIAAGLIGAFAGTLSVTAAAPGVVAASAGTTALVANCAPSLALGVGGLAFAGGGVPPALLITVPLAIIAALALIGGLVAMHVAASAALAALAFCPVSNFAQEPMQALVSSQPYLAFPDELMGIMEDGLDGGMPLCGGLKSVPLKQTHCEGTDRECHELACREKCCEDEGCTFYQFELDETKVEAERVECRIGEKHQLIDANCEKPFFGEMCTSRLPLWPQDGKDNTKCVSGYGAGEGFMVDDQADCQETAIDNGHCFYQYNKDKNVCATCKDLSDTTSDTRDNWKVFKDPHCGGTHVEGTVTCTDWAMKSVLLSKIKGTEEVRPNARGCRGNSASCLKKKCRQECSGKTGCTFYQFQEGENKCYLGQAETLDAIADVAEPTFGGFVSAERRCKTGFQCPSNNQCLDDCSGCEGYSQNGPEPKGRGRNKRKWCMRNAPESLCYETNWVDSYRGVPVNEWCRGMDKVTVEIKDELDARENGENICRKACCADPDCAVFQMHEEASVVLGHKLKVGSKIECWMGMETEGGKPKFKCTGRKLKRNNKLPAPFGKALSRRGCTDGSTACLTKGVCVDHCRTECAGAPMHNDKLGTCEPKTTFEEEHLDFKDDKKHQHAFKDNLQNALPKISQGCSDTYYLDDDPLEAKNYRATDDMLGMQLNSRQVATGKMQDMSEACQTLKDDDDDDLLCWFEEGEDADPGACHCEFSEKQSCRTWFADKAHLKHVVEDVGMLLFGGDKCECTDAPNEDGEYSCVFGLLPSLPTVCQNKGSDSGVAMSGTKKPECALDTCKAEFQLYDQCSPVTFSDHNCGYSCHKNNQEFYCDKKCNCHRELDDKEIDEGIKHSDDTCTAGKKCGNMISCEVLDYGEYGCGYSCLDVKNSLYFCNQDCECDAE